METVILGNKYKIVDTLYQSDLQNIYIVEDIDPSIADQFLINEVKDGGIIHALKKVFNEEAKTSFKNFLDYFNQNSSFCIVSSISAYTTLDNYLSTNSLRLSDKMYITENLLVQFSKLDFAGDLIKYHLLSPENISVAPNRTVSFNLDMKFQEENLYATSQDILSRLGDVLCCVFANTPDGSLEKDKDSLPPTIYTLVKRCKEGGYPSSATLYNDFKASLLYTTFIDNSVNKQIMKNIQKAKRKHTAKPFKRVASLLIILAILVGGYFGLSGLLKNIPALGNIQQAVGKEDQIPVANFTMSKNKVYVGDSIDFLSQSTDPDINDKITAYEWSVSRNGDMFILFSREANPSYAFDREGDYVVSLIVKDSTGISSKAFTVNFTVYPKEEIPDVPATSGAEDGIRK